VATTYLSRRGHWQLPRLWSAISSPTLRPDGTVLQEPGYDAATQSWYDPCGIEFPKIPESPTREDAEAALKKFSKAFDSFPFESKADNRWRSRSRSRRSCAAACPRRPWAASPRR
jgi:putative DNA primase/helicase